MRRTERERERGELLAFRSATPRDELSTNIRLLPLVASQGILPLRAISRVRTPIRGVCRNRVFAELPQRLRRAGIPREVFIHQGNSHR